jgi:hypothetical protein
MAGIPPLVAVPAPGLVDESEIVTASTEISGAIVGPLAKLTGGDILVLQLNGRSIWTCASFSRRLDP